MAYSTSAPPMLLAQTIGGTTRLWVYRTEDAATAVRVSGYFTNGYSLGMRAGDLLLAIDTNASPISQQWMVVNESSKSGSTETVDVSDGVAITATDSD